MLSREDQNNSSHMSTSCLWMWAEIQEQAQDNTQPAGRGSDTWDVSAGSGSVYNSLCLIKWQINKQAENPMK